LYIVAAAGPSLNNTALLYVVNTQGLIQSVPNFPSMNHGGGIGPGQNSMAVDKSGNLFVVTTNDASRYLILRVTPAGSIITYAGGGNLQGEGIPATTVGINYNPDIAIAADGDTVLFSDSQTASIRRVTPDDVISTVSTTPVAVLAADGLGNIYFASGIGTGSTNILSSISSSGVIQIIGGGGTGAGNSGFATDARIEATAVAASWQSTSGVLVFINGLVGVQKLAPAPSCSYSLNPASNIAVPASGSGATLLSIQVSASSQLCPWTATVNQNWIGITSGSSGTGNGTVSYVVTANSGPARSGSISIGGLSFAITQFGTGPTVVPGGVLNAASYAKDANGLGTAVAPGSLVQIYGSYPGATAQGPASPPFPSLLGNTSVTLNGIPAPLSVVAPSGAFPLINAQIPSGVLPTGKTPGVVNVVVTVNGAASPPQTVPIIPAAPGIFTTAQNGLGQAILVNVANLQIANPSNPIPRGGTAFFYATGLGGTTPSVADGSGTCPASNGLCPVNALPTVLIGGVTAQVLFAGQAPGYPGVNQINVVVPANAPTGNAVPLQIVSADGSVTSNTGTIAVN
jgi:uncharacterized protein (TIGR03437 family)